LILDGTVVRIRLDKATSIALLVVLGVREDGQKVLVAVKNMGGETSQAWRAVLDDLVKRGLGSAAWQATVLDCRRWHRIGAGAGRPLGRRTDPTLHRHKHRNLLAHAPQRPHEEVSADYTDMIYAAAPTEIEERRRAFIRKWRLKCKAVADSLEEAGDRLFTFTRLPPSQWKSARTTNAIERLHEEFKRRIRRKRYCLRPKLRPCCSGRCLPLVKSPCEKSTAGKPSTRTSLTSRLTSLPDPISS
jgi:transposase-like protein